MAGGAEVESVAGDGGGGGRVARPEGPPKGVHHGSLILRRGDAADACIHGVHP